MRIIIVALGIIVSAIFINAQERPYHQLKIWRIKTNISPTILSPNHTIYVYKFQVDKTMVCKAFVQSERVEKEYNNALTGSGMSIGLGVSVALASLGDVPCE